MRHPSHNKAQFKYNGGRGALICSECRVILKTGDQFTDEEIAAIKGHEFMPAQYCKKCQLVQVLNENSVEWTENIRSMDDKKYKVISFHPPLPKEALDIITSKDVVSRGSLGPNDDQMTVHIYFPM